MFLLPSSANVQADTQEGQWVYTKDTTPVTTKSVSPEDWANEFNPAHYAPGGLDQLIPSGIFGGIPDLGKVIPDADLLGAKLPNLLSNVDFVTQTATGLLGELTPKINDVMGNLQTYLAGISVPDVTGKIAELFPQLAFTSQAASSNSTTNSDADPLTFNYTGAVQTYTVPAGVTQLLVEVFGAQGGGDSDAPGGLGGRTIAVLDVVAGQVFDVYVGGIGTVPMSGFSGGGQGGVAAFAPGGGGGGLSSFRRLSVVNISAGSGGGGGGVFDEFISRGVGGAGGGGVLPGQSGAPGGGGAMGGGGGGSNSAGGTGGVSGLNGEAGYDSVGGSGGGHSSGSWAGGGGGGSGRFGGGGGGSDDLDTIVGTSASGGGGGGPSLLGAISGSGEVGVRSGNGQVNVTPVPSEGPQDLPTTYEVTLQSGYGTFNYSGQICVPTSVSWNGGAVPNEIVNFCPTAAPSLTVDTHYTGVGEPPAGSISIVYQIPPIPQVLPNGGTLRFSGSSGGAAFPAVLEMTTEVQVGAGAYADGGQGSMTIVSQSSTLGNAPLASVSMGLDNYGLVRVNNFPGGTGVLTLEYSNSGTFEATIQQSQASVNESIYIERRSGPTILATASVSSVPQSWSYSGEILYHTTPSGEQLAKGIRLKGKASSAGTDVEYREYTSSGQPSKALYQRDMPATFDKTVKAEFDPTGEYVLSLQTKQENDPAAPSTELLELASWTNGTLNSTVQVGGASASTSFVLEIEYDHTWRPQGFHATAENSPDTNAFYFQGALWSGGSGDKVFTVAQGSPSPPGPWTAGAGTNFNFSASGMDPNFSFSVLPLSSSATTAGAGFEIQSENGSNRPQAVVNMSARDQQGQEVGVIIKQLAITTKVKIDIAVAGASPTGVWIDGSDSTTLTGRVRQFYQRPPGQQPTAVLTIHDHGADLGGTVGAGSIINIRRVGPPPHFSFDVTAPAAGACIPTQIKIHTNNYNLASSGNDFLEITVPGVGGIAQYNIPQGQATRTASIAFDAFCKPSQIKIEGVADDGDQPDESLKLWNNIGQFMVARLAASFTTTLNLQLNADSPMQVSLSQENVSTNLAGNPGQFIQFGTTTSPNAVFTVHNGFIPSGALPLDAPDLTVKASGTDPKAFTIKLTANLTQGLTLALSGTNLDVQANGTVSVGRAGVGSLAISNLDEEYEVTIGATADSSGAGRKLKITGSTVNDYPNQIVTLSALHQGISAAMVISGPGVSNPPAPAGANIQASWINAPRNGFGLEAIIGAKDSGLTIKQIAGNAEPGSRIIGSMRNLGLALCNPACHVAIGGGVMLGTTSINIAASLESGHFHMEGAYPATPTTQYAQVWSENPNGSVKVNLMLLGGSATPYVSSGSHATAYYSGIPQAFELDVQTRNQGTAEQEIHVSSTSSRTEACSWCGINIGIWQPFEQVKTAYINMWGFPSEFQLDGVILKEGCDCTYTATQDGLDAGIANDTLGFYLEDMPTKITAKTAGKFEDMKFTATIDTDGSLCPTSEPRRCGLGGVTLIVHDLKPHINEDAKPFGPFKFGPGDLDWVEISGTYTVHLNYQLGLWLDIDDLKYIRFKLGTASPIPLPMFVLRTRDTKTSSSDYQYPSAELFVTGPNGYDSPVVCAPVSVPPCSATNPDRIDWTLKATSPVNVLTLAQDSPRISSPSWGQLYLWGWDSNIWPDEDRKYKVRTYSCDYNYECGNDEINTSFWDWNPPDVPFTPHYSLLMNYMGGPREDDFFEDYSLSAYVLNPQNFVFRAGDQSSSCPRVAFLSWTTNCAWQLFLNTIPGQPINF